MKLAGLAGSGKLTTRRWYYFIPATGTPKKVVHAIEPGVLDELPGDRLMYAGRRQLEQQVTDMLRGCKVLAMEYSPECSIPYLSRVDAGTVEFLRRIGMRVISSGNLVQRFEAAWDAAAIETHRAASEQALSHQGSRVRICRRQVVGGRIADGVRSAAADGGVVPGERAGRATPTRLSRRRSMPATRTTSRRPRHSRPIRPNELVLLDLWGKLEQPGAVYADITWVGFRGHAAGGDRQGLRR